MTAVAVGASTTPPPGPGTREVAPPEQIALVDLLDRLLGTGVVLAGDVVISLSGVDLVRVRLHALVTTIRSELEATRPVEDAR